MQHLLKLLDLTGDEIIGLLNMADQLKYETKNGVEHHHLKGKTLGLIFTKSSTRTRVSFEVGMVQLGGYPLFLSANDLQLGRGEPIEDTAKVLSRYIDGIMIRTFKQSDVEDLAKYGSIPVINGLTDSFHPCQVLADLMTIREHKKVLSGLKMCFVGDGHNMANSLTVGGLKVGMEVVMAMPKGYDKLHPDVMAFAKDNPAFKITDDIHAGVKDADVVVTDVWTSMDQGDQAEARRKAFAGFQVNDSLMTHAKPDAIVLHCLPAHRGEEITAEIMDAHPEIIDEAENRLHAQKAVLVTLLKDK
ncbi:MAG: ornithine carbamoyltransferase [Oscillospiraceae bacterium]|nr:ornithine carbamoyltransferase [Oscillospiraceae bacterium]